MRRQRPGRGPCAQPRPNSEHDQMQPTPAATGKGPRSEHGNSSPNAQRGLAPPMTNGSNGPPAPLTNASSEADGLPPPMTNGSNGVDDKRVKRGARPGAGDDKRVKRRRGDSRPWPTRGARGFTGKCQALPGGDAGKSGSLAGAGLFCGATAQSKGACAALGRLTRARKMSVTRRGRRRRQGVTPPGGVYFGKDWFLCRKQKGDQALFRRGATAGKGAGQGAGHRPASMRSRQGTRPMPFAVWIARPGRALASKRRGPSWASMTMSTPR
jgi:hypothetical protein